MDLFFCVFLLVGAGGVGLLWCLFERKEKKRWKNYEQKLNIDLRFKTIEARLSGVEEFLNKLEASQYEVSFTAEKS